MENCEVCNKLMHWNWEQGYYCPEHPIKQYTSDSTNVDPKLENNYLKLNISDTTS